MPYWLVKSEPFKYAWDKFVADGRTHWDGVRNYQAANNLKAMKVGDRAFFYHSNEGLEIVGIAEVVREAYPDPSDESGRFVMVDLKPVMPVKTPLTLKEIKADPELSSMALVRQSRLSVCPITDAEWKGACQRMGVDA
ncbi:EVE domain-containing protein [Nitrospirillum amazonense]|uniref:Putative RNA-binding protein with PUA-like domain n=1 Tax=Nitrospirillum amazonense TaxID=28077 RepID=A0A560F645_9PROT|nr:EVE domain-containing protein [Nitrospirillum amazonense]MDG3440705.1 EVE domain-containing protein [Nitrospirillum amazonense]MEC4594982.1 EVE domain-containing protein [Nitrospirillum amazonense]TWB17079.1 putative RNA-binding protein with PUA-like domain [Nitrospirillum amazonense]TWB74960.1 putative RNA-binding protein with PUA-like domain [Nitrospirillum amazonense]